MEGLVLEERLLIPMRNVATNALQGYQQVYWDGEARKWEKKMLTGMRAKNAVLYMGDRTALFKILVEGYATALSVRAALKIVGLNASVICCFSASNLVQIASSLSGKVGIYADNDQSETGEKSAIQTGLPYVMSHVLGHDANDDMKKFGSLYVAQKLMELNQKCKIQT
jgi:putative DNA primase/helicase